MDVYQLIDGTWQPLARLDEESPQAEITVADHGTVDVDLAALLPTKN